VRAGHRWAIARPNPRDHGGHGHVKDAERHQRLGNAGLRAIAWPPVDLQLEAIFCRGAGAGVQAVWLAEGIVDEIATARPGQSLNRGAVTAARIQIEGWPS